MVGCRLFLWLHTVLFSTRVLVSSADRWMRIYKKHFATHPWNWCGVSKQIVSWPPGCLFCVGWILQASVLSLPCLSCGQVLAPRPLWLPSEFPHRHSTESLSSSVPFVNAMQGLLCPSSFLLQSADGLSSLSGFFVLTNDGKGLWSSVLSVTAWASVSHTPLLPFCLTLKTYCQGVVDNGVHPAEEPLFVVVWCSFAKGNCLCGSPWNSCSSSGLLN